MNEIPSTDQGGANFSVPHLPPFAAGGAAGASPSYPSKKQKIAIPRKKKVKESIIDHTYRDYSQVEVPYDSDEDGKKDSKSNLNFPAKLHAILSNPGYRHIICWMPHGRSWNIVDKYQLVNVILPKHFAHAKFESFNRSVNGWGFKRLLGDGPDKKTYYHECFLRGRPDLTRLMQRLNNPGKRLPDKSGEPNFYEISKNYPLPEIQGPHPYAVPEQHAPKAVQASPTAQQPGQQFMMSPPPHGYMYGYPQPAPYPPMGMQAPNDGSNTPQQPQQMYWQGPPGGSPYQPHPYGYGYYPYHPQMMMPMMAPQAGPGQQGYYMMQPYHQPQYYPQQMPTAAAATPDAAGPAVMVGPAGTGSVVEAGGQYMMPMGTNPAIKNEGNGEKVNQMLLDQESTNNAMLPKETDLILKKESKAKEASATTGQVTKSTKGPKETKKTVKKESETKEVSGTTGQVTKSTKGPKETELMLKKEGETKEVTGATGQVTKSTKGPKETELMLKKESESREVSATTGQATKTTKGPKETELMLKLKRESEEKEVSATTMQQSEGEKTSEATKAAKNTEEPKAMKPASDEKIKAEDTAGAGTSPEKLGGTKPAVKEENNADKPTEVAKDSAEPTKRKTRSMAKTESSK